MLEMKRFRPSQARWARLGALAILTACGGDSATGTDTTDDGAAAITAALTITPTALPNYAAQPLPAFYSAAVRQREDRTPFFIQTTDAGATLGRVLFYDRRLSFNSTTSCASCHAQASAFTDTLRFSRGFQGGIVSHAHSMRLANARFNENNTYFWDNRAASLELQTTQPIQDAIEMGFTSANGGINALITRMQGLGYYRPLFRLAFGDSAITEQRMQFALAQYIRSIVSTQSKWDLAYAQVFNAANPGGSPLTPLPGYTAEELRGQQLFMLNPAGTPPPPGVGGGAGTGAGCARCHVPPSYSLAGNSASNGLDAGELRVFRSPSLKNVALSRRFMHDGRFATLDEVVEHYNSGVRAGPALDPRLTAAPGVPLRLNLTAADKAALVAFMRTLSDQPILMDTRFSDPFRR